MVIDEDLDELPPELVRRGVLFVRGNPTRDETLSRASLDSASHAVVLCKKPGDPRSDDLNVSVTLAIEARSREVYSVVECADFTTRELLKKAGCDRIVCTSRFEAHFLSHELLNPGVQEVVEELTSNLKGQQIYVTPFQAKKAIGFEKLKKTCADRGHMLIGVRRGESSHLNPEPELAIEPGDDIITIGAERLGAL